MIIEAMKQALEALDSDNPDIKLRAGIALRQAIAEAESMKCIVKDCKNHSHEGKFVGNLCSPCYEFVTKGQGVYSQAYRNTKREWVGLTDEELKVIHNKNYNYEELAYAVEAKLKEKNT